MSDQFFEQLGIPEPDVNLGSGSGTPGRTNCQDHDGLRKLLMEQPADLCLVVGDVTSTGLFSSG